MNVLKSQPSTIPNPPPIHLAEGVMDLADAGALGLGALPCETVELFRGVAGAGFSHHSGLAVFRDRLFCSWSCGVEAEDAAGQRVLICRVRDDGAWSRPEELVRPEGEGRCIAAGLLANDDTLTAYYTVVPGPAHNLRHPGAALFAMTSSDGARWSAPRKVASGFFIEAPLRLPGGRLVVGGEHAGRFDEHAVRMRMLYTDDPSGLDGWTEAEIHPERAEPKGLRIFDYTEPCPFVRGDGALVTTFRNYSGHLFASESRDAGATWSVPVETNFPDSMARCHVGTLPDGTVYLVNNPGPGLMNRRFLTLALSADGRTFTRAGILRSDPPPMRLPGKDKVGGWQYPCGRFWRNRLHVSYSLNKEDILVSSIALEEMTVRDTAREITGAPMPSCA